jgi:LacI family transcriptional regulator
MLRPATPQCQCAYACYPATTYPDPTPIGCGRPATGHVSNAMLPISPSARLRVTQSDIARIAGVHNTTVSLSLRNCPSIPEATRNRIRAIADKMGYFPDPTLQALVAYRKGRTSSRPKETLAYLTNWSSCWGWRALPAHERAFIGAQRKAAEFGYQLEHFWLGEPGMNQRRMSSMLYHRGIRGALVAAHQEAGDELSEIDWSRLSAVKIGCFPHGPALHRVIDDHCDMVRLAMRRIRALGFERVGLVMAQGWDDISDRAWSAGFMIERGNLPSSQRIPIFKLTRGSHEWTAGQTAHQCPGELASLAKWQRDYRPEVIVGYSPAVLGKLGQLGMVIPRDVAYVDLCLDRVDYRVAGVRQNGEISGEVAASMLVGQLQQNLCGLPAVGTTTMVAGTWIDGASLPAVGKVECLGAGAHFGEAALLASA